MKFLFIFIYCLFIFILLSGVSSADYWNTSWSAYSTVTMNNTAPDNEFQLQFTNDTFSIPLSMWNEINQDGNDTRILNYNHTIEFPFWIEHLTTRDNYSIWVNATDNTSATYQWYYGNPSVSSTSNIDTTMINGWDFKDITIKTYGKITDDSIWYGYGADPMWYGSPSGTYFTANRQRAIYNSSVSKTFFAITMYNAGGNMKVGVGYYDHSTNSVSTITEVGEITNPADPHSAYALAIDKYGYLIITGGTENLYNTHFYRSTNPYDTTAWGGAVDIYTQGATYPEPFVSSSNKYYVFSRLRNVAGSPDGYPKEIVLKNSIDNGTTWSVDTSIILTGNDNVYKVTGQATDGSFHIVWMRHTYVSASNLKFHDIFYQYTNESDIDSNIWKTRNGTSITLPTNNTTADPVYISEAHLNAVWPLDIQFDSSSNPYILYINGTKDDDEDNRGDYEFVFAKFNVTSDDWENYQIVSGSDHLFDRGSLRVINSTHMKAYLTLGGESNEDGGEIKLYNSSDGGVTWDFEKNITNTADNVEHNYPITVKDSTSELRVIWSYGDYGPTYVYGWGEDEVFTHDAENIVPFGWTEDKENGDFHVIPSERVNLLHDSGTANQNINYASITSITGDNDRIFEYDLEINHVDEYNYVYLSDVSTHTNDGIFLSIHADTLYAYTGVWTSLMAVSVDTQYHIKVYNIDLTNDQYDIDVNGVNKGTDLSFGGAITSINYIRIEGASAPDAADSEYDNILIRKQTANESIVIDISESFFYTDSLHYNASSPYNFTIEYDGTLTSNRSIITTDDTNDTAQSTGTSYLIINVYDNTANIVRNFTFTGDDLDWYQAANLSGTYNLKNSSGIIETKSNGNFTTNLTPGTYWIETTGISISLISFTPTPLYTNYTGTTVISYMVESHNPLNLSSLAFLYGLNYTTTSDMHNYITSPPSDIASEGIYIAPNRNITPYLSWEFNDTITEGNVWKWGGGDNNSWWIEKNPINSTHTYINATGVTQHVLPSSFYIQKLAMYNAPKTGFEINRQQGIIFKMWNIEEIRNRGHNYFANLYFDTSWETTLPNYPVEIGYCNFSYDPTVDDIDTCQDCIKFGEWDGNRWVNHSWVPGANASYAYPLVINGSQYTEPTPTDINYIWLRSNTISSKSYILNATDYDPGITNITFAETNTMWTYNELNGVTSPVAYTPSFFTTFVRNDEELLHHLYIADDTGAWSHSDIFSEPIGISSIPVQPVSFDFFNITCEESYHDYEMDATYDLGTVGVGMHCPADPDGTTAYHNLTLHYYPNMTLVAVINNTFMTNGVEDVEIEFTTTPYYSSNTLYTLRCVSKDGDDNVATKWLISYFALDADGNQGWVKDDKLLFWGMNDIPTLYMEVNNSSMISYDGGSDIYTMHVPFFKSKGNDTFNFNETVHLESLNNEDVVYFRFTGRTNFDNAIIHAWNTTTDTAAPITDEYRGYVYSLTMTCGNITNSNFSYLGSDFYRQEGLNFVGNSHEYLIYNSTFSHNGEGPIFEECSNFTISNCTISGNVNVGIAVYFSDNFIIENNTISSNGGRGVAMYEANNNIISYNDITNSGIHGVHYWSNSINNTCTGNDISGSALYDYYLSSSSTGNFIINPASTTDRIRVTSTSSVNIENTDNAVFSEDSLNISYAYLTNFSMYVSGASQTIDITQRDMTITPSNDNLSIQNFDWGNTIQFNAESSIGVNQTWFNITNTRWKSEQISIFIDGLPHNISHADDNGTLDYNYSVSIGDNFFEFILTIPPSPVPVSLFMFMGVLLFVFCGASFILTGIPSIFTSILSIMFSFIMSKIAVNGSLVQNIGGISSTGTVVQGVTRIEIPALSYILIFVGIFMTVILAIQVLREIKFRESQDKIELDI